MRGALASRWLQTARISAALPRGSGALDPLHLAGEQDEHGHHHPCPPAVHEVEQEEVVGHGEAYAAGPVDPVRNKASVHVRPRV